GSCVVAGRWRLGALCLPSGGGLLFSRLRPPLSSVFAPPTSLLGGFIYPGGVPPPPLQWFSKLLPATHALAALRAAALSSAPIQGLLPAWGILTAFALVLWPTAAAALAFARRHLEQTGTLPHG